MGSTRMVSTMSNAKKVCVHCRHTMTDVTHPQQVGKTYECRACGDVSTIPPKQ